MFHRIGPCQVRLLLLNLAKDFSPDFGGVPVRLTFDGRAVRVIDHGANGEGTAHVSSQVIRPHRIVYRVPVKKGNAKWLRVNDPPHPRGVFTTRSSFGVSVVGQSVDMGRNRNKLTGRCGHLNIRTRLIQRHFDLGITTLGGSLHLEPKILYLGDFPTKSRSPIRIFLD